VLHELGIVPEVSAECQEGGTRQQCQRLFLKAGEVMGSLFLAESEKCQPQRDINTEQG